MSIESTLQLLRETNHLVTGRELDDDGEYDRPERLERETEQAVQAAALANRRLWAASMLCRDLNTCTSVLRHLAVRAGNLDAVVLRRALRGAPLPPAANYIVVTDGMLDAIAEAGPLEPR